MDFRVLGPLEAGDGREFARARATQAARPAARLLLDAGRAVSVDRLLDDLWGEDRPETAVKMVQIYVSGLRKVIGAGRLLTAPPGYRLVLGAHDARSSRFTWRPPRSSEKPRA